MKKLLIIAMLAGVNFAKADEKFEINRANCNLPMKKIRKLLPDKAAQKEALRRCMEKAAKERWKRPSLMLSQSSRV